MMVKSVLLSLLVLLAPMAALGEDAATQRVAPEAEERVAAQPAAALPLGTYQGPEGETIEVKEPLSLGGKASDLAAKGIVIVNGRPAEGSRGGQASDSTAKAIEIVNGRLTDGVYVGPGGASFRVEGENIIIDNAPAPSR
jgi:hypothetical protein